MYYIFHEGLIDEKFSNETFNFNALDEMGAFVMPCSGIINYFFEFGTFIFNYDKCSKYSILN